MFELIAEVTGQRVRQLEGPSGAAVTPRAENGRPSVSDKAQTADSQLKPFRISWNDEDDD